MKDSPVILKDVSLCAIVRDEMMNSAGGIEDFVRSTLPFVTGAVIVDTGSKDGTWEKLQELKGDYPCLEIFQRRFRDFAFSRNFALSKVKTGMVLVLDADERLFEDDFRALARLVNLMGYQKRKIGISLVFWWVYLDRCEDFRGGGHNPPVFRIIPGIHYKNLNGNSSEYLYFRDSRVCQQPEICLQGSTVIKHFCPSRAAQRKKHDSWYRVVDEGRGDKVAPSETPDFDAWKELNPRRREFA